MPKTVGGIIKNGYQMKSMSFYNIPPKKTNCGLVKPANNYTDPGRRVALSTYLRVS